MRLYFDCDALLKGATCKIIGEHDHDTIKLYQVKLRNGMKAIVKLCQSQTKPEYGWKIIAPYTAPEGDTHICNACGDKSETLCNLGYCSSCCLTTCAVCSSCQVHDVGHDCSIGRCSTCCARECKICQDCFVHCQSVCKNKRCDRDCRDNCSICARCGEHVESQCQHCSHCEDCCECRICVECTRLITCNDCDHCRNHCTCERRTMARVEYGQPWVAKEEKDRSLFDCERLIGVEWEYNSVVDPSKLSLWQKNWHGQLAYDGSCGQEAVTPPLAGNHIVNCLTDLGKAFQSGTASIDNRCGIHVHVDAGDLSWFDMFRFLKVYSQLEPLLYLLAGQDRIKNRYCIPCGESFASAISRLPSSDQLTKIDMEIAKENESLSKNGLPPLDNKSVQARKRRLYVDAMKNGVLETAFTSRNTLTGFEYQRRGPGKKDGNRYKGLNLCPWLAGRKLKAKDTTLEFRIHRNVKGDDYLRVINWAKICAKMVDWTSKANDQDVDQLPKSSLRVLSKVIAPECSDWIIERFKLWKLATSRSKGTPRIISFKNGKYLIKPKLL